MEIRITNPSSDSDIQQMLVLQQKNQTVNLDAQTIESQGFVTVRHTFDLLKRMNETAPQIIAKDKDEVVGYALVMLSEFRAEIPVLEPMFQKLEHLNYQNKAISDYRYFVMGQICIAEAYRGLGIFDKLYEGLKNQMQAHYDLCVTEVATRNTRSMRAHQRAGFETVLEYQDETDHWALVVWKW